VNLVLGIDLACRAAHQGSLARADGTFVWSGRRFFTTPKDLRRIWSAIPLTEDSTLTVVMEPTRNAWAPVAAWFRRRGARIVMVPTTQSADLRAYYSKHTKNDQLDSKLLARLPLLHPEGLREQTGNGPADSLRRAVKVRSSLVKRRTAVFARLDALLEMLGPAWYDALGSRYGTATLALLTRYADPNALLRLGSARLAKFLARYSRGQWGQAKATELLAAARESLELWEGEGIDFDELAADIAVEAEQAQVLTGQVDELDERIATLYEQVDPKGIVASAPGVGPVLSAAIAGRIGDPHRFTSLAAIRAYSGLVPKTSQSGLSNNQHGLTKAGDSLLRESLFNAADSARKVDPRLAARYARLIDSGKHHNSALCHVATELLTRIASSWRSDTLYQITELDGTPLTADEGRRIVSTRHRPTTKTTNAPATRQSKKLKGRAGREQQESPSAPASRPAPTTIEPITAA
jgi:transposase